MTPKPAILLVALALLLSACTRTDTPGATAPAPTTAPASPRIISTVPAATLNLILIGAAPTLVGVTKYDTLYLPPDQRDLPVVGDYETMNYEQLVSLHPSAVIIQKTDRAISQHLRDLADQNHFALVNIKLDTLDDLWNTVATLGRISNREPAATAAILTAKEQLQQLALAMRNRHRPTVLYIVGTGPLSVAGGGTFMDRMVALAGGDNLGAKVGDFFPTINNETLVNLAPDVLLLSAPDQPPEQPNDPRIQPFTRLPIPAAWNNRIHLVTDGNALMASVQLPQQVQQLAALIHKGEPAPAAPATEAAK